MLALALSLALSVVSAEEPALSLHAKVASAAGGALTIDLFRWSTDAERAPVLAALAAPAPVPAPAAPAGAAGRAGRAGRAGGRGAAAPAPVSPEARLAAAIKRATTLGYIWGDGVTGYSIKYAWRPPGAGQADRVVLMTDRLLGEHAPQWALGGGASSDAEYTLIEMRLASNGTGEGKTSLVTKIALDATAHTLALDGYATAPVQLRITR
jgi:hypothetical protein